MDLLPWSALIRISKHMEDAIAPDPETGKPHYPERNWEQGMPMHTMIDSAFHHLAKYMDGWTDEDHLCAAATNLLMALWTEEERPEMQDIPSRPTSFALRAYPVHEDGQTPSRSTEAKEGATETTRENMCSAYIARLHRCSATREKDECKCGGDEVRCDFYNERRLKAIKERYG